VDGDHASRRCRCPGPGIPQSCASPRSRRAVGVALWTKSGISRLTLAGAPARLSVRHSEKRIGPRIGFRQDAPIGRREQLRARYQLETSSAAGFPEPESTAADDLRERDVQRHARIPPVQLLHVPDPTSELAVPVTVTARLGNSPPGIGLRVSPRAPAFPAGVPPQAGDVPRPPAPRRARPRRPIAVALPPARR
jgi:hypothetical protein